MNESSTMDSIAVSIADAATDAAEVARRLASSVPLTGLDAERTARILDRLSEELGQAAADLRRNR